MYVNNREKWKEKQTTWTENNVFQKSSTQKHENIQRGKSFKYCLKKNFKEDTQVMQLFFNMKIFKYISHAMLKILKGGSLWSKTLWRWNLFNHMSFFKEKTFSKFSLSQGHSLRRNYFWNSKTAFSVICAFLDSSRWSP